MRHAAISTASTNTPLAQQLVEGVSRGFYPIPYSAAASNHLLTPWYLDYGHLSFWFFVGSTIVIVLWLAYVFTGLARNIEERRPVRETRGFSRAQTGDTLTAVLPLTWSITMLGHASTHSINFDENTTATVLSFTVIAYQWGWNYFFPREVVQLLSGASYLTGRGRVVSPRTVDAHTAVFSKLRGDYQARVTASQLYTAKHGRHTVSAVLSALIPTLMSPENTFPAWVTAALAPALRPAVTSPDARLLLSNADARPYASGVGLVWKVRAAGLLSDTALALHVKAADAALTLANPQQRSHSWLFKSLLVPTTAVPNLTGTQNQRPVNTAAWVGNRLAAIYQHLMSHGVTIATGACVQQPLKVLSRHVSAVTTLAAGTPAVAANRSFSVGAENLVQASSLTTLRPGVWAGAVTACGLNKLNGEYRLFAGSRLPLLFWIPGLTVPTGVEARRLQQGDSVSILGGDSCRLTPNDSLTNVSAGALEFDVLKTTLAKKLETGGCSFWSARSLCQAAAVDTLAAGWGLPIWFEGMSRPTISHQGFEHRILNGGRMFARPVVSLRHRGLGNLGCSTAGLHPLSLSFTPTPSTPLQRSCITTLPQLVVTSFLNLQLTAATRWLVRLANVGVVRGGVWLEAASDSVPNRVAGSDPREMVQLNAKGGLVANDGSATYANEKFVRWAQVWASLVGTAGLPLDRLTRSQYNRRPLSGVLLTEGDLEQTQAALLLSTQRERFDKAALNALYPLVRTHQTGVVELPTTPSILDSERLTLATAAGLILPMPYLDLDVSFLLTRWAAEVNTSRRSDHDARFRVTWGPLAAGAAVGGAGMRWELQSGAAALATLPTKQRLRLSWLLFSEEAAPLAYITANQLALSPAHLASAATPTPTNGQLCWGFGMQTLTPVCVLKTPASVLDLEFNSPSVLRGNVSAQWVGTRLPTRRQARTLSAADDLSFRNGAIGTWADVDSYPLVTDGSRGLPALHRSLHDEHSTAFDMDLTAGSLGGYSLLRADIGSMRRLRVTKGVYLPADVPMHGIFGSKDVIHSWAIPGLGVKIDCIPGYSSHRRLLLRWRGIYWGQCMEVCGRYHHWMPILVRVVHRDMFMAWCLTYLRSMAAQTITARQQPTAGQFHGVWETSTLGR